MNWTDVWQHNYFSCQGQIAVYLPMYSSQLQSGGVYAKMIHSFGSHSLDFYWKQCNLCCCIPITCFHFFIYYLLFIFIYNFLQRQVGFWKSDSVSDHGEYLSCTCCGFYWFLSRKARLAYNLNMYNFMSQHAHGPEDDLNI